MAEQNDARVTIEQLYTALGTLRDEINCTLRDMRDEQRTALNNAVARLETSIATMHAQFVSSERFEDNLDNITKTIDMALENAAHEHQMIWDNIHRLDRAFAWAASIIAASFLGLIVYLIQQHLS